MSDGSILRALGLLLEREESIKRPLALLPQPALVFVCAWCQRERGLLPQANESHGICERHAAQMRAEIERAIASAALRAKEAA